MEKPGKRAAQDLPSGALYHLVPPDMHGTVLHPLNRLKETHPDLYASKVAAYEGRERFLEKMIPSLEAAWNDVLHLTAVSPHDLKQALVEAGYEPAEMKFYQVDPSLLDPARTTIYLYQDQEENPESHIFLPFNLGELSQHAVLPEETKNHYRERAAEGKHPFLFVGVPHILHKGSIDVSNLPVITV